MRKPCGADPSADIPFLKQLNVERDEVEEILIDLILEGKVQGRIDQVGMRLEIDRQYVTRWPL